MSKQTVVVHGLLYLDRGDDEDLEVPIEVVCRVYPYVPGTYYDPPEYPTADVDYIRATDGTPWSDELETAFAHWWEPQGIDRALELASEDNREYERDDRDD